MLIEIEMEGSSKLFKRIAKQSNTTKKILFGLCFFVVMVVTIVISEVLIKLLAI